jgi:type II secretory pathway pseudopilin PulG
MVTPHEPQRGDLADAVRHASERGLSLVEIVVAMFLLALVSIAFLPLLINSLQISIRNATISTATQVLNDQLDALTATAPTCAAVTAFGTAAVPAITDRRGVTYQPVRTVPACSSLTFPDTVTVQLRVQLANTTVNDVDITTSVLLQEAG